MSELVVNGVQIYQFPTDDDTTAKINGAMNVSSPLPISLFCENKADFGGTLLPQQPHLSEALLPEVLVTTVNIENGKLQK